MRRAWRYHREHGSQIFDLDQIDDKELLLSGWEDVPFGHPSRTAEEPETDGEGETEITKESLEQYAREKYGVNLDKRKKLETLIAEVEALDNGNGD